MSDVKNRTRSLGAMLLGLAAMGQAKDINYTPDVTSDAWWDRHHIDQLSWSWPDRHKRHGVSC